MSENSAETPSLHPAIGGGPGRLIRQAREAHGLSVEDLAAVIKLSRHTVEALERDDFATLKEPVYVRGYYRKLAKVLPLQEADLIASYDSVALPARPPAQPSKLILSGERDIDTSGSGNKALVLGLCAVAAIALGTSAFLFVRSQQSVSDVVPGSISVLPATPVASTTIDKVLSTPAPTAINPAVAAPASTSAADPALAAATAPAAATVDSAPPATGNAATTTLPTTADSAPPATAPDITAAPAAGGSALVLVYSKDCWTRIEDADGKTLLSRIVAAGETLSFSGKAPFAVTLGHAPGVEMRFNGTLVDMSGFTRRNGTARFSLP